VKNPKKRQDLRIRGLRLKIWGGIVWAVERGDSEKGVAFWDKEKQFWTTGGGPRMGAPKAKNLAFWREGNKKNLRGPVRTEGDCEPWWLARTKRKKNCVL